MILYNVNPVNFFRFQTASGKRPNIGYNPFLFDDCPMSIPLLNEKLNTETARISWEELQPHFARGAAVYVAPDLDLIAVARHVAEDEAAPLKQWMEQGKFGAISDDMARTFLADKQEMWAVVVAPWVLVQPCKD